MSWRQWLGPLMTWRPWRVSWQKWHDPETGASVFVLGMVGESPKDLSARALGYLYAKIRDVERG